MWRAKLAALALVWLWFALLAGCSGGPRFHPVQGKVFWRGKPAAGARVIFHPISGTSDQLQPSAIVNEDGSFHLGTRAPGDGAPSGEYQVTIDWFDLPSQSVSGETDDIHQPTDKLGGRYADPNRSSLRVTVKEGENLLPPFELQ